MGIDRDSIYEAARRMNLAASVMQEIMRVARRSELHRAGRVKIDSDILTLQKECPKLKKLILRAVMQLRDDWPEIEGNKARRWETAKFFETYQKFMATALQFDDWRQDCYDDINIFPQAHEIAMSLVLVCGECDEELSPLREMFEESGNAVSSYDRLLLKFEDEMKEFCCVPIQGGLIDQVRHPNDPVFRFQWIGAKNELTLFGKYYDLTDTQLRMIFDFSDDKKTKQQFAMSRYPCEKLGTDNRLYRILQKYPKEVFYK